MGEKIETPGSGEGRIEDEKEGREAPKPETEQPETPNRKPKKYAPTVLKERVHTERITVHKKSMITFSSNDLDGAYKGKTFYVQVTDDTSKAALETFKEVLKETRTK